MVFPGESIRISIGINGVLKSVSGSISVHPRSCESVSEVLRSISEGFRRVIIGFQVYFKSIRGFKGFQAILVTFQGIPRSF